MIIWIASYPKSGNTYLRSFLASYYYSDDGKFEFDQLEKIRQFPNLNFSKIKMQTPLDASRNWIINQKAFFNKENFHLVKTHNCLYPFKGNYFTSANETLGAVYIIRDPRNVVTSLTHHYSLNYKKALNNMTNEEATLVETSFDKDFSNFTFLNSWSNHYKSWKNNSMFETLFIKYEDLEKNKEETFKKVILFINKFKKNEINFNEKKFLNSIKSTNFNNLKNKELNEGFEESVYFKKTKKKVNFFNLGFNNRWKKILSPDMIEIINKKLENEIKELGY